jgi:WD40 repeat protein
VVNGHGNTFLLLNLENGEVENRITTPGWITRLTASPDFGFTLTCSQWANTIDMWDNRTCLRLRILRGHFSGVLSLAFGPDSRTAVSGGKDRTIRLWDTQLGKEVRCLKGHEGPVESVAISPDGKFILSGSSDQTARLWDIGSGVEVYCFRGHTGAVTCVAFSPDDLKIATGSSDKTLKIWDVQKLSDSVHVP